MKRGSKRGSSSSLRGSSGRAALTAKLISWFDGYAELYTVDPLKVERALKDYAGTDLDHIWKSVRSDVNQIVTATEKSPQVEKSVRRASLARRISMIVGAVTLVILVFYIFFQNNLKNLGGANLTVIIPGIMLALLYGFLMFTIFSTRSLNKSVRTFYDQHSGEFSKQRSHMREATQLLIDRLAREIYSHNFDPGKFKFEHFHSNYKNISVVREDRGKFVSTVKIRAQSLKGKDSSKETER